ncbi:complement factor I [Paramisgurnus dabryanus]|uniref:complement factor I n=1 Tax=Paramisgurnus dabryanus TaxID=90735 RepID=UPI0031F411D5
MKLLILLLFTGLLLQAAGQENDSEQGSSQRRNPALPPQRPIDPNLDQKLQSENSSLIPSLVLKPGQNEKLQPENSSLIPSLVPKPGQNEAPVPETTKPKNESKPINVNPEPNINKNASSKSKEKPKPPNYLGPQQCLDRNYTHLSCAKVFCPPWMRCLSGECVCKIPYKCPRQTDRACGLDGSSYSSMCQAKAISCRSKQPTFSHFSPSCSMEDSVRVNLKNSTSGQVIEINTMKGKMLVCVKYWNMAAANVVCRNTDPRGAEAATKIRFDSLDQNLNWPSQCVSVQCRGSELSLAECTISNPQTLKKNSEVAVSNCYKERAGGKCEFSCVNRKCVPYARTCDGVDDCGDNSDEMCCQKCKKNPPSFHCSSGVCIPAHAVNDGIRDCLGGEDESPENQKQDDLMTDQKSEEKKQDDLLTDPKSEIRTIRTASESQLQCGVPNMDYIYRPEDTTNHQRKKRLVGGEEALPTQIQWQVAVQDEGSIHCGGAYLGGCWVLTAAHCVRPKPKSFRIKISLWKKHQRQSTTDSIPVKNIIIHHQYNAQTYENDIALIQMEELNLSDKCMEDNPAVRPVCVPWSTEQFQPKHTCTISGWGRNREGMSTSILKWANVTIISDCESYYSKRFRPGMECAGDLEGNVDSCQGDSGGPLVCKDALGVSYVWGIVSWGDKCGEPNHPGVYTKVAHYFEWIRFHTGWPAVTRFNQ